MSSNRFRFLSSRDVLRGELKKKDKFRRPPWKHRPGLGRPRFDPVAPPTRKTFGQFFPPLENSPQSRSSRVSATSSAASFGVKSSLRTLKRFPRTTVPEREKKGTEKEKEKRNRKTGGNLGNSQFPALDGTVFASRGCSNRWIIAREGVGNMRGPSPVIDEHY